MQTIELRGRDGTAIAARRYDPADEPQAAVVIGGAMGVRQDYYGAFAEWLSRRGYLVFSFDYRGTGASRPPAPATLRGFKADLFDWVADYDTVIDAAALAAPGRPLVLVGHSLGAQLPGLLRNRDRIAALLSVAAGSGYWRDNASRVRYPVLYFWHVLVPLLTRLFGYFPGQRLRKVGDLPRGVVLQWRRWCLSPRYHVGAEGAPALRAFAAVRFPVLAWSITDDELMTERGTQVLVDCYANAPREVQRIAPHDVGAGRIGHFGFFRTQFQGSLWPRLESQLRTLAQLKGA